MNTFNHCSIVGCWGFRKALYLGIAALTICPLRAAPAIGQFNLKDSYENSKPIVIESQVQIPEGVPTRHEWESRAIKGSGELHFIRVNGGTKVHCWANPGEYEVKLLVIYVQDNEIKTIPIKGFTTIHGVTPEPIPIPTPTPEPEPEPEPEPLPPQPGPRNVLIIYESADELGAMGKAFVELTTPGADAYKYRIDNKHQLLIYDDDSKDGDNQKSKVVAAYKKQIDEMGLPLLVILDAKTKEVLKIENPGKEFTADNIIEKIRQTGG